MATRAKSLCAWILCVISLSGCISAGISDVDVEPGFDWDALKRDEIVMTPFIDLRQGSGLPANAPFFTDDERHAFPERFKQVFFKVRKDIHVYGAGGAFENLSKLTNLKDIADDVIGKRALKDADVEAIKAANQGIRFVFFFAMVEERLTHDFSYDFRRDKAEDVKIYMSTRDMTMRLALWDSQSNKTVWRGTEHLRPTEINKVEVRNPNKRKKKEGDHFIWVGTPERTSLSEELRANPGRFPSFPNREPSLSGSFEPFALALPIQPSEAKLIEYTHFSYHRPEMSLRVGKLGTKTDPLLEFGFSSAINYNLRFGAAFMVPLASPTFQYNARDYQVDMGAYGLTFDYEWTLSPRVRLLAGTLIGGATFSIQRDEADLSVDPEVGESDSVLIAWPRAQLLFGAKDGFQAGIGAGARIFSGIEEPIIKAHEPSAWSIDLTVAYATRGF